MLMDTEEQCHRTCFALHLNSNTLDAYTELKNIPGMKEGAEIKVLEGRELALAMILQLYFLFANQIFIAATTLYKNKVHMKTTNCDILLSGEVT